MKYKSSEVDGLTLSYDAAVDEEVANLAKAQGESFFAMRGEYLKGEDTWVAKHVETTIARRKIKTKLT